MNGRRLDPGGLLLPSLLLAASLALHGAERADTAVQDLLFDFASRSWCVDSHAALPRALFYRGPKLVFGALALLLAARLAVRRPLADPAPTRREAAYLLACLALVPAAAGALKHSTAVPCPWQVDRYGGELEHRTVFSPPPAPGRGVGHCFPAAHASGGFALLAFAHVGRDARRRRRAVLLALAVGCALGGYQMLRGAHYLSHTVFTMLLAWLLVSALARLFGLGAASATLRGAVPST